MTYNIGYKGPNPIQDLRYKNFYVGNIDSSGNVDISGNFGKTCKNMQKHVNRNQKSRKNT